jgi:hypothetical protein
MQITAILNFRPSLLPANNRCFETKLFGCAGSSSARILNCSSALQNKLLRPQHLGDRKMPSGISIMIEDRLMVGHIDERMNEEYSQGSENLSLCFMNPMPKVNPQVGIGFARDEWETTDLREILVAK